MPFAAFPAIAFPAFDPVAIAVGPIAIRWYALAYVVGILIGWRVMIAVARRPPGLDSPLMTARQIDDFVVWAVLGVIFGGRLGYVLFYKPLWFLDHPLEIFAVWHGGMSFHGGLTGVILAIVLFAWRARISFLSLGDLVTLVTPIGLFLGRCANFINGELFGRVTDVPWAIVFPRGGPLPRHPSQLYEATLEGIVLFAVLAALVFGWKSLRRPGLTAGAFLTGYGLARIIAELFREPDAFLGFIVGGVTMGQILSLPLIAAGVWLIWFAARRPPVE